MFLFTGCCRETVEGPSGGGWRGVFYGQLTAFTASLVTCQSGGLLGAGCPLRPGSVDTGGLWILCHLYSALDTSTFLLLSFWVNRNFLRTDPLCLSWSRWLTGGRAPPRGRFSFRPPCCIMWTTPYCSEAPPLHGWVCWDVSPLPQAVSPLSRGGLGVGSDKKPSLCPSEPPGWLQEVLKYLWREAADVHVLLFMKECRQKVQKNIFLKNLFIFLNSALFSFLFQNARTSRNVDFFRKCFEIIFLFMF